MSSEIFRQIYAAKAIQISICLRGVYVFVQQRSLVYDVELFEEEIKLYLDFSRNCIPCFTAEVL